MLAETWIQLENGGYAELDHVLRSPTLPPVWVGSRRQARRRAINGAYPVKVRD